MFHVRLFICLFYDKIFQLSKYTLCTTMNKKQNKNSMEIYSSTTLSFISFIQFAFAAAADNDDDDDMVVVFPL